MITVWGRKTSVNVQTVMWALAELGLECERLDFGGAFGGTDTAEYRAMNPNGLVPVIRDKGQFLWESAAIVRYLGAAYGDEKFWPADPLKRAAQDKWSEWIKTTFGPTFLTGVFWPTIAVKPESRDETALAASIGRLKTTSAATRPASPTWSSARRSTATSTSTSRAPRRRICAPITTGWRRGRPMPNTSWFHTTA